MFESLPGPVQWVLSHPLLTAAFAFAFYFVWHMAPIVRSAMRLGMKRRIGSAELSRFTIAVRHTSAETEQRNEELNAIAPMIAAENFGAIYDRMRRYDAARACTPFGRPLAGLILDTLMADFSTIADAVETSGIDASPEHIAKLVAAFDRALEVAPDDHIAAATAALAHIEAGWLLRGDGFANEVSAGGWQGMAEHFDAARRVLDRFPAQKHDSPLLAYVHYRLCNGLTDGEERIRAAYTVRTLIEPQNPAVYIAHGFQLLPRWYGSYEELEQAAREAADLTMPFMGTAGYALTYLDAIHCDGDAAARFDATAFAEGLLDFARYKGSQYAINFAANTLWMTMADCRDARQDVLDEAMAELVREDLCCILPDCWEDSSANEVMYVLARYWQDELAAGATVDIDSNGAYVHWPEGTAPPQPA